MKSVASGLRAWLVQRFSALYMLIFLTFALTRFSFDPPLNYADWQAWNSGGMRVADMIFAIALIAHAWIGLRDVVMDYIHPLPVRLAVLALIAAGLVALLLWLLLVLALA